MDKVDREIEDMGIIRTESNLYNDTDIGNGKRLVFFHGDKLRYLWDTGQWLFFDDHRWNKESGREKLEELAKVTSLKIYDETKTRETKHEREQAAKWAFKSEAEARLKAMENMARSEKPISTYSKFFDVDPMQFNSQDWLIDLKTGNVTKQQPEQNLTQIGGCKFDENATCPTWDKCVDEWMEGDAEKVKYLQTILGYCLTGDISARLFPIFHGHGFNGKSKCLDALKEIMGDYATLGSEDLLTEKKFSQHPTDIMKLKGRRLVLVDESKSNMRLRTSLVKRMTGDTELTGRYMRQDFSDFKITHKLILMTQNLPVIIETADAIWDRVHLLKWNHQFVGEERDCDLAVKLRQEYPGILNWLIKGCLNWQKTRKIEKPNSVKMAGNEYQAESDPLNDFIEAKCLYGQRLTTKVSALKQVYKEWAETEKIKWTMSSKNFNEYFRERGCEQKPLREGNKVDKYWFGIGLSENSVTL